MGTGPQEQLPSDDGSTGPDEPVAPGARLVARATVTDRASRFEQRLVQVEAARARRRRVRAVVELVVAGLGAAATVLGVLVVVAVAGRDVGGGVLVVAAVVGGVVTVGLRRLLQVLARRRGAGAWDWHRERYVLLGRPATRVRDADRPDGGRGGAGPPLPPPRGR